MISYLMIALCILTGMYQNEIKIAICYPERCSPPITGRAKRGYRETSHNTYTALHEMSRQARHDRMKAIFLFWYTHFEFIPAIF